MVTECNTEIDIDKEIEKDKESEKEDIGPPVFFGIYRNVKLTSPELENLKERFPDSYQGMIDKLSVYLKTTGRQYKSHYLTLIRWDERDKKEAGRKKPGFPDYSRVKEGESY